MRGKKPKERKNYILRTENGTLVEVTREVYLEWYQSRRREKYQQEQKQKYGVCSLDVVQEGSFAKTSISQEGQPEEMAVRSECLKKLKESLGQLPEQEALYVLEILMKKFVLYQKVSIQKMDAITRATLETLPIKNLNVSDIYIVKDNEISHSFYLYFHSRYALEPFLCVVYDNDTDRLYSNCAMLEMYITILHGIDVGEIETDSIKYHNYLNTLYSYNECKKETEY